MEQAQAPAPARRYNEADLLVYCRGVLEHLSVPSNHATETAACLLAAELRGVDSHGLVRLPVYAQRIEAGVVNPAPAVGFEQCGPSAALADGDNGMGPVVGSASMRKAMELAEATGLGLIGVRRSNHFGAAAFYVRQAVERRLIGIALSNAPPNMAPFGGRARFLGTNPLAVGIPAGEEPPLIFDASTSVVARGKIIVAAQTGARIPAGWAIDTSGRPTTDPDDALAGAMLPFGGPKGSSISFIIDILCGVLTGAAYATHLNTLENLNAIQNVGHTFIAIRPDLFIPAPVFQQRMDEILRLLKSSAPAEGVARVLAPGELEWMMEAENGRLGIPISPEVQLQLDKLGSKFGLAFPAAVSETPRILEEESFCESATF